MSQERAAAEHRKSWYAMEREQAAQRREEYLQRLAKLPQSKTITPVTESDIDAIRDQVRKSRAGSAKA